MSDEYNTLDENSIELNIEIPPEVTRWNWSAFLLPFLWALFNVKAKKALVILILNLLTILPITVVVLGGYSSDPANSTLVMTSVILLFLNFPLNFIISILFGLKGNFWAWQDKVWESIEQFCDVQSKWTKGVLIGYVIGIILSVATGGLVANQVQQALIQKGLLPGAAIQASQDLPQADPLNGTPLDNQVQESALPSDVQNAPAQQPAAQEPQNVADKQADATVKRQVKINKKDIVDNSKTVTITIGGHGRENPFKPFYDKAFSGDFPPPDDIFKVDDTASSLMSIQVAGVLYDSNDPTNASAIVKIANTDYMVKKGDTISGYKILVINRNNVAVKYGANTYSASIGQTINPIKNNTSNSGIDNINRKFAGNRR